MATNGHTSPSPITRSPGARSAAGISRRETSTRDRGRTVSAMSVDPLTAVDIDDLARDEVGLDGRQERDHDRDIFGSSDAADRNGVDDGLAVGRDQLGRQLRLDGA